jgi:hypothetical protein
MRVEPIRDAEAVRRFENLRLDAIMAVVPQFTAMEGVRPLNVKLDLPAD